MDFSKKYRPTRFDGIVGQSTIVKSISSINFKDFTRGTFLFSGESGTGKTTLARIFAMALNCSNLGEDGNPCGVCNNCVSIINSSHPDVLEVNAAKNRGIDNIRSISESLAFSPIMGNVRVILLDEAHALTKDAQNSLLKILEDTEGVCAILCSTEPHKLIKTVKNRCQSFSFKLINRSDLVQLLEFIRDQEEISISSDILERVVKSAGGRPRNAVLLLQQISNTDMSEEVLNDLLPAFIEAPKSLIEFCTSVVYGKSDWRSVMSDYKALIQEVSPDGIRLIMAGFLRTSLERASSANRASGYANALRLFIDFLPQDKPENQLVLSLYDAYVILKNASQGSNYGRQR
jgi:DNA polymerase-3 subunit gamma/tau